MKRLLIFLLLPVSLFAQDNLTARRPFGQHTVSFSATPTFDAGITDNFKITLTGNVTSSTLIGAEAGHTLTFEICQDGVGGRTFAWPSQMVGPIAILSGAAVCTLEFFQYDGAAANNPTTATGGGGGAGTVAAGTAGQIGYYGANGTTVSGNAKLDEGNTTANTLTYTGVGGIVAPMFGMPGPGGLSFIGNESTCSGATTGKDVLCLGDLTSDTAQISNNGDAFRSIALHESTSPVPSGIMVMGVFPRMYAAPRGALGQPFIEGTIPGGPGFGQLDLSLSTNVVNRLVKANQTASTLYNDQVNTFTAAGTLDASASTVASAFRVPVLAGLTTALNGAIGYDSTNNMFHGGMNAADSRFVSTTISPTDTFCAQWTRTSGHYELGQATGTCGTPGGAGALSGLTAATAANSINSGDNAQQWNALLTTAGKTFFRFSESGPSTATGTPWLVGIDTVASSTANPWKATALGTVNGVGVLKSAFLTSLGVGGIDSNMLHCDVTTTTKCAKFVLSGITAANTRSVTVPDAASTFVVPDTGASNNFVTAISPSGAISKAQPSFSNLSGSITTTQTPAVLLRRSCVMVAGTDNGSALVNADIAPQLQQCQIPYAATVVEIDVRADAGTPNVIVSKRHCTASACTVGANETVTDLVSSALATGTSGAAACSNTGGTAGFDTFTTCSATLQNTSLAIGDYIETRTATAGGTAKRMTIFVHFTVN